MAKGSFRPKQKLAVVEQLLAGESPSAVAKSAKIDQAVIEKWHNAFLTAGKNALRYTGDEGEIPNLVDLERTAQRAFPIRLMHECNSVAAFFCAQFYGKNDIIHVYKSGVPEVTLVDLDEAKLDVMKDIYPDTWNVVLEDAFEAAQRFAREEKKFDAVICDPYSSLAPTVAIDRIDEFLKITNKYLLFFCTQGIFEALGSEPELEQFAKKYSERIGRAVKVKDLIARSSHAGGVYWCVLEV